MAATAISLHLRSKTPTTKQLLLLHHHPFSSSSNDESATSSPPQPPPQQPSFSSYFSDVKSSLKNQPPPPPHHRRQFTPSPPPPPPSKAPDFDAIHKSLANFRLRSVAPPSSDPNPNPNPNSSTVSFQELYKRNLIPSSPRSSSSYDTIRDSLRKLNLNKQQQPQNNNNNNNANTDPLSLSRFKESLKLRPALDANADTYVFGLGDKNRLPMDVFGKELKDGESNNKGKTTTMRTEFVKMYGYKELGQKLRELRPEGSKGGGEFSLAELNERLVKLREIEENETSSKIGNVSFRDLRESLIKLQLSENEEKKNSAIQKLEILNQLGQSPAFLGPPKEHLVEKYFHPDNMSSSEKLKLELQKVREEFKMSESDCGSARVQVAQLTTKIKHLASVLHKKDKHSRKGFQGMIQQRKKLLKYLRRTDWDSYTLVLSKLGLRDNPDYKN